MRSLSGERNYKSAAPINDSKRRGNNHNKMHSPTPPLSPAGAAHRSMGRHWEQLLSPDKVYCGREKKNTNGGGGEMIKGRENERVALCVLGGSVTDCECNFSTNVLCEFLKWNCQEKLFLKVAFHNRF